MPDYIKRKTRQITINQMQLTKDGARMTESLEEELEPNLKCFEAMVTGIPEKYMVRNHKVQIIKNKENDANRIISARVLYKISN